MKLGWLTDIHLNLLQDQQRHHFYHQLRTHACDALLITGDISEAPILSSTLVEMCEHTQTPLYFVLGNHDYYRGEIEHVRQEIHSLSQQHQQLHWLPTRPQALNHETVIVGQDGWADGRHGDYAHPKLSLAQRQKLVELFKTHSNDKEKLFKKMQYVADQDAKAMLTDLENAKQQLNRRQFIVLTHVPPFEGACQHNAARTNAYNLPLYCSKAMGDALTQFALNNTDCEILVLCGHTHEKAAHQPLHNLSIMVGGSDYGSPCLQKIIHL